ncbi:MAG: EamA family transporter, partial [Candidatus Peribacteraceae bacterium]|nr:EamA family transporter [Candidatus Peribacteraceae bacterium]
ISTHTVTAIVYGIAGVLLMLISTWRVFPVLEQGFWPALAATTALNMIAIFLQYRALVISDFSIVIPMLAYTPLFLIATSSLILGERPSPIGLTGILLIVGGSMVLLASDLKKNHKNHTHRQGVFLMLCVAFLFSISVNFDKLAVLHSDTYFPSALSLLILSGCFAIFSTYKRETPGNLTVRIWICMGLAGIFLVLDAVAVNIAFTLQIVPYVIGLKRLSVVLSVLVGLTVFRDRHPIRRILGAILMFAGAGAIALAG